MNEEDAQSDALLTGIDLLMWLNAEEEIDDRAWSMVENWVAANANHIQTDTNSGMTPVYGRLYEEKLYLNPKYLREMLETSGFSYEKCYSGFKDRGYIDSVQIQMRFDGVKTKSIGTIIDFKDDDDDIFARRSN